MATPSTVLYQDFSIGLTPVPSTGDISVVQNEVAIIQSVKNLVMTKPGERPFQENVGSQVPRLLFDLPTPITRDLIRKSIQNVITNYEPRATLHSVDVQDLTSQNAYKITIQFTVNTTATQVTFSFLLTRVR